MKTDRAATPEPGSTPRWLVLVHQIPNRPSKLRVKVWRRLQGVGAVAVKNSVYVLPHSAEAREDLEWIRGEIVAGGGEAVVFAGDAVDEISTAGLVDAWQAARRADWDALRDRAGSLLAEHRARPGTEPEDRRRLERESRSLHGRAQHIDRIDRLGSPGRPEALAALRDLEGLLRGAGEGASRPAPRLRAADFAGRTWLTRPRPGVDRMASAWLIRRFVDPGAEFAFSERIPPGGGVVPFDMFGVELGHHGDRCTFETLLDAFGLEGSGLRRIARVVHALDLRTDGAGAGAAEAETATVGALVAGLRASVLDDGRLLDHGIALFEALFRSWQEEAG